MEKNPQPNTKQQKKSRKKEQHPKLYVVNRLKDGTIRKSMKGYEVPYNETTAIAYRLLAEYS